MISNVEWSDGIRTALVEGAAERLVDCSFGERKNNPKRSPFCVRCPKVCGVSLQHAELKL